MEPILVWGAGAIGGTVGAFLRRAGHDVTFVDVLPEHAAAIANPHLGLSITGPIATFTVTAPAFLPDRLEGTWRRILLAVKAQHTAQACRQLLPHLAPDGTVLSLQNGLNERTIAGIVGSKRTMGAFINFGADWLKPGEIIFANRGAVVLGEIDGETTPRLAELHGAIRAFEPDAIVTSDIWGYLWGKLGYAALLFAQALGNLGIADCLARAELLPLWRALAGEAVAVALADGVTPRGFNGYDPAAFTPGATAADAASSVAAMVAFNRPNAKTHSGIWRDLAIRKRPTEVDQQIVPIAEIGASHGFSCPATRRLAEMIHEIERGIRAQADRNLDALLAAVGADCRVSPAN